MWLAFASLGACTSVLGVNFDGHLREVTAPSDDGGPSAVLDASDATVPVIATAVSAGGAHACALTGGGAVRCWGWNKYGQLGTGDFTDARSPVAVATLDASVTQVAAGGDFTCAVQNKALLCWGNGKFGQLGNGSAAPHRTPGPVSGMSTAVLAVATGEAHACALLDAGSGRVACWGNNSAGQLGDGTTTTISSLPVPMDTVGAGVTALAAGSAHTCAMTKFGTVWCWGSNEHGQLGNGPGANRATGALVAGLEGVVAIAAGGDHTCARTNTKQLYCWGANASGELGDGTTVDRALPYVVNVVADVATVAAGARHTCVAYTTGKDAHCWGDDTVGQLGDGLHDSTLAASVTMPLLAFHAVALTAGMLFTCALGDLGQLACWGSNTLGELGTGLQEDSPAPTAVAPL